MRRLLIDESLREVAKSFRVRLEMGQKENYIKPLDELEKIAKGLDGNEREYVQHIIDRWDDLIVAEPDFSNIIEDFEKIIPRKDISNLKFGKTKLYEKIVKAMRYDYVQGTIYSDVMKEMGIKTCVYCNAQYIFVEKEKGSNYLFKNYEIDHWKSQSHYPYLSTTFFNLQPCCSHCNKIKLQRDALFGLFTHDNRELFPMKFCLTNQSVARYLCTHDYKDLRLEYDCKSEELKKNQEEIFHITTQYQAHKDVVEEIVWKNEIYNSTFQQIYMEQFKSLGFSPSQFNRFIIGNYDSEEDIHKRPLSKLTQDIAKQLKLI